MLRSQDRLAAVANALRASTSEPNLRKKLLTSGNSQKEKPTALSKSKNRSSSSDSSENEEKEFLKAELILKFKKYDQNWFKEASKTHPEYFVDSRQYVHYERNATNPAVNPSPKSSKQVNSKQVPLTGTGTRPSSPKTGNRISSVRTSTRGPPTGTGTRPSSPKFGTKLPSMKTSVEFSSPRPIDGPFSPKSSMLVDRSFSPRSLNRSPSSRPGASAGLSSSRTGVRISSSKTSARFSERSKERPLPSINPLHGFNQGVFYGSEKIALNFLNHGTFLAETTVTPETPSRSYEVSYCPVDESIICLVTVDHCYLMRATTNIINIFSSIKFTDLTCHSWADDVTLAFGTVDGRIRLYRETVPLEIIDLKKIQKNF
ncbi:hypothetical protein FO519_006882, partial [Halicephalobus sp. NKZ332]